MSRATPRPDASAPSKWLRRAVTVPGLVVLWLLDLGLLPALVLGALVVDLAQRRRFAAVRFQLALAFALAIHVLGLVLLLGGWLEGLLAGRERERQLDAWSEVWWATATWRTAVWLYGMRVVVEGEDALDGGPLLVLARHVSLLDILLPIVFVGGRHGLALRYVVKRELLWDPCVDFMGHRLRTAFVRRQARGHDADVAAVGSLAGDLGPRDAIVIFPEGTRFTEAKRAHVLELLARADEAAFAHGSRLAHLLPPHPGGPLGLLARTRTDVVFCAHTGLEEASHLRDLARGSLIGATVRVRFWRVPAREVPEDPVARLAWLRLWWERLDRWIDERLASPRAAAAQPTGGPRAGAVRV